MEQLLDEQPIIEYDVPARHDGSRLLVAEIRVVERLETQLVALGQHSSQLGAGLLEAARHDEGDGAEVDEPDLAAVGDPPSMAKLCRKTGLPSVGDLRSAQRGHTCIVVGDFYKA